MLSSTDYDKLQQIMQENPENEALINRLLTSHQMEISTISHEIRNPLTLVYSTLQLIEVSTTSPAGGLVYALPGRVAFPPEGGLTNHSFGYWWPLKSGSFLLLRVTF